MAQVQGTQVVGRVAELLRLIGGRPAGASTAWLVRMSGLTRPTAYRILTALAAEGLLDTDPANGNWVLGTELFLLGSAASTRFPFEDLARPSLRRVAEESGESAFYSIRRSSETVCLLREEGSFPVRSFVLREGVRFPLGVASAGTAIMAFLPDEEQDAFLSRWDEHAGEFASGHTEPIVRKQLAETRLQGYSLNPGLVLEGSWGMGAAVFDRNGSPVGAVSITGIEPRFRPERQEFLGRLLLEEAHRISARLPGRP
ncbi:IclR family transcriptional regulator [Sinomonas sp. JGH33]|uniref:IclR family transcriptional regulator n=1 Tax=Sinomonas terricola TaxID=3110330 RepID=A0ABU5T5C7_9MICC|nr:IclR family transcriptional regulator [Sinomonas sp. JGH33]MEA5454737.1 IclR family transcriptional regulator [Sinomonas sp. JGH33]